MNRRSFLSGLTAQATLLSALPAWSIGEKRDQSEYGASKKNDSRITKIGQWSLEDIRDIFRREFFENNLPVWRNHVVDWKYGGYLPHIRPYVNDQGEYVMTDKRMYHQGRCLWLYSYIFNNFDNDEYYLRAAKAGYDFLVRHAYNPETREWNQSITREGDIIIPFHDIFACIYMILGLGEYYKASGVEEVQEIAVKSAHRVMEILTSNWIQIPQHGPVVEHFGSYREPGTRRLGCWMHFLSTLTPLLKYTEEPSLEMIVRFCVRNILERHYQRDKRFAYEFLQWDYTPYSKSYLTHETMRVADGFHSVESAWMSMDEALRVGSREMFLDALGFGKDVMEMLWLERDGKQGLVRYYWPVDPDPMKRARILSPYVMNEVWVLLLLGLEHTREQWLVDWFDRSFTYSYETAKLEFPYGETLHHPRGLMFGMEILDRMIARKAKVSDFFDGPG